MSLLIFHMSPSTFCFKPRTYLHFDLPVSRARAEEVACNPQSVATHSFLPFLGYTIKTARIKRDDLGRPVVRIKEREIKTASHLDAAIYTHYSQELGVAYEAELRRLGLQTVVTAFRRNIGGTNVEHAREVFQFIESHRPCVALAFDVEKFFDTLDHSLLKEQWKRIIGQSRLPSDHFALFSNLTRFSWVDREDAFTAIGISKHNPKSGGRRRICSAEQFRVRVRGANLIRLNPRVTKGVPQGSPISALLSNVYMLDFDHEVHSEISRIGGLYRRYCDDVIVVVPIESEKSAFDAVQSAVGKAKLEVNPEKVHRARFPDGSGQVADKAIQYLGFTYDGKQTLLRASSLNRYYSKMRAGVSLAKQAQRKQNRRELKNGLEFTGLKRRKIYLQYSYLIRRTSILRGRARIEQSNFLTYAYKAAKKLDAPEIKRQIRNHWPKLQEAIARKIPGQLFAP